MTGCRGGTCFLVAIAFTTAFEARAPLQDSAARFRSSVDAIPLHISVTDSSGQRVTDLQPADFSVTDNGQKARIVGFSSSPGSLAVRVLFADSRRAKRHRPAMIGAARRLIDILRPDERLGLDAWSAGATSPFLEPQAAADALERLMSREPASSDSAITSWPALAVSAGTFLVESNGRLPAYAWLGAGGLAWPSGSPATAQAVILFSTGMDEAYDTFPEERELPRYFDEHGRLPAQIGVAVFGIALDGARRDARLRRVAEQSGGWFVAPQRNAALGPEMDRILTDLRGRYLLAIEPGAFDGRDRRLEVRVHRPGVTVRNRQI